MGYTAAALIGGALSGTASLLGAEQSRMQQRSQAKAMQGQADLIRQKSEVEARQFDQKRMAMRREFEKEQGHNRSLLAAGNVDMSSGSALDVSQGNIDRFALDVSDNAYQKALNQWQNEAQAKQLEAQASSLKKQSGSFLPSLLTAAVTGLTTGLSIYGGGGFGSASKAAEAAKELDYDEAAISLLKQT